MRAAVAALAVVLVGCTRPPSITPFPHGAETITVLPPRNRTGDDLAITGTSLAERAFRRSRVTVPDVLADETATALRARGYRVEAPTSDTPANAPEDAQAAARIAAAAPGGGLMLYLEIWRWEPDAATQPVFMIVGVSAALFEAGTGRPIWSARTAAHPVATPGSVVLGVAHATAARKVVGELFPPAL